MKLLQNSLLASLLAISSVSLMNPTSLHANPAGGALTGQRYRVLITSDIGGSDPDDFQSMVHYFVYSDLFDTEGIVASPPGGNKAAITATIAEYEKDYSKLQTYSANYPSPTTLRNLSKQGATAKSPTAGYASSTEGSRWIVQQAKRSDSRPLYILIWGCITDVAQAVHDDPTIKPKLRLYQIGAWNTSQDQAARNYLYNNHSDLWWIENDTTFRGMYVGGNQTGDLGNCGFVSDHVRNHGALGNFYYSKKTCIKMGDSPSVLYLLRGDPNNPTGEHWGGRFVANSHGPNFWVDRSDNVETSGTTSYPGAGTVSKWRESYLRDWQARMDRCVAPNGGNSAPSVSMTSPANGSTYNAPASISMSASATDSNGSVSKVEFMSGSSVIGADTSSPYAMTWNNVGAGNYTLNARATDNGGATTTSSSVNVSVIASSSTSSSGGGGNVLNPIADTYVRDGVYVNSVYGTSTTLQTKSSASVDVNRHAFLKFDISSIPSSVSSAKLRVYGKASQSSSATAVHAYGCTNDSWTESGTNWNNKPATSGSSLSSLTVLNTAYEWKEFTVTSFINSEKAAGQTQATIVLKHDLHCTPNNDFHSREASSNKPELVIVP